MGEYVGIPRTRPFFRYLRARHGQIERQRTFQEMVTEQLRLGPQGKFLDVSMYEEKHTEPQVKGEDIALYVINKAGLEVRDEPA